MWCLSPAEQLEAMDAKGAGRLHLRMAEPGDEHLLIVVVLRWALTLLRASVAAHTGEQARWENYSQMLRLGAHVATRPKACFSPSGYTHAYVVSTKAKTVTCSDPEACRQDLRFPVAHQATSHPDSGRSR